MDAARHGANRFPARNLLVFPRPPSSLVRLRLEGGFISREIIDMGMSLQGVRGPPDEVRVLGGTDRRAEDVTHALSYYTNAVKRCFSQGSKASVAPADCFVERLLFRKFESRRWLQPALTARRASLSLTATKCAQVCLMKCWDVPPTSTAMTSADCHGKLKLECVMPQSFAARHWHLDEDLRNRPHSSTCSARPRRQGPS